MKISKLCKKELETLTQVSYLLALFITTLTGYGFYAIFNSVFLSCLISGLTGWLILTLFRVAINLRKYGATINRG